MLTTTIYYIVKIITSQIMDQQYIKMFALKVRMLREQQGLSQEQLAAKAGLHRTYIGMIERSERNPSLVSIYKIAKGLNINIKELF